jgi:hypothetical protein
LPYTQLAACAGPAAKPAQSANDAPAQSANDARCFISCPIQPMGELCTRDAPHNQAKVFVSFFQKRKRFLFCKKETKTFLY